jgi:pimeloyl-ACP methyl ester carboxylesterase
MTQATREHVVRLSDGAETRVEQWGERGPLIVGVHGVGGSRRGWARIGEHLAGRFRVVAYDQRGHGDSAQVRDLTFARTVRDAVEVVASLGEPVRALLGHSWGGAIAIGAGREAAVERVVAFDPMLFGAENVWRDSVMVQFGTLLAPPLEERERLIRTENAALPQVEIEAKLHAGRRITLAAIAALGEDNAIDAGRWNFRHLLDDYPRPLLIAVAGQKRSVFLAEDRVAAAERGGPKVRLEVFEGASHSLQRDAFERVMPVVEGFLER